MDYRRRYSGALALGLVCASLAGCGDDPLVPTGPSTPVLGPTTFIDPDILTDQDATALAEVVAAGQGSRTMFDNRVDAEVTVDARLFDASFDDGLSVEIQVNPEFGDSVATELAEKFARSLGRAPYAVRRDVVVVWIHDGVEDFGYAPGTLLIHTQQATAYENDGFLEEAIVHQAVHVSLDADHATSAGWLEAQRLDNGFISENAQESPATEDVAESFIPYLAVVFGAGRVTPFLQATIASQIPARLTYFDDQGFNMHPLE